MRNKREAEAPSFKRILVKHGITTKDLPIPDAYELFLRVSGDSEIKKLRNIRGHRMAKTPEAYVVTIRAVEALAKDKNKLAALKQRLAASRS